MAEGSEANPILKALGEYEAENRPTKPLYDEWANTYENDLLVNLGYSAHVIAAEALADVMTNRSAAIIDIGCGTGLVGLELAKRGFTSMDGIDISADMLAHATAKSVYRHLMTGDMNGRSAIADAAYDAAICAGSFAPGHLGHESHLEFIRIVKPGSPVIIFMNGVHFIHDGYEAHIRALEDRGLWRVASITGHNYMSAIDRPGRLIIARKA